MPPRSSEDESPADTPQRGPDLGGVGSALGRRGRLGSSDGDATLEVEDDGRGFEPGPDNGDEHFGLRMLADLARDAEGRLSLDSRPGEGTRIRLEISLW